MSRCVQLSLLMTLVLLAGCAGQQGAIQAIGNDDGSTVALIPYRPPYYYQTSAGVVYFCPRGSAVGGVCRPVFNGSYNYYGPGNYNYQPVPYQPVPYQPPPPPAPAPQPCSGTWLVSGACAGEVPQPAPQPDPAPAGTVPADNSCGWWRLNNLWGCNHP